MHGFLSGKNVTETNTQLVEVEEPVAEEDMHPEDLGRVQRRISAIQRAKQKVERLEAEKADSTEEMSSKKGRRRKNKKDAAKAAPDSNGIAETITPEIAELSRERELEEERRKERVKEIDRLIVEGQAALVELQCEKDALQRRPNPLYNYSTEVDEEGQENHSRDFNFPPDDLVEEYLDELFTAGRLVKMNHTHLWKSGPGLDDDDDETIGDDLLTPSADARKLYEEERSKRTTREIKGPRNGGGGSWLLRQASLGEKIGEATEVAGYKSVCASVMASLARSIGALHGINIMTHTDVRLYMENAPDLPPLGQTVIPGSSHETNYAQEAIREAMLRGIHKRKKKPKKARMAEAAFLQRDAVVETLISHCQISAPLLKLFPLAWQRALLANMITLIVAVVSDFCDGIQLQILGHALTFSFRPITEKDLIRHIGMAGNGFNHRRARPEEFEAAVQATAEDVSASLKFLDRWHERALGSGLLRAQIANLIARIVLTLADEVLSGARLDLWSAQAGGPRMVAGLEYRTTPRQQQQQQDAKEKNKR